MASHVVIRSMCLRDTHEVSCLLYRSFHASLASSWPPEAVREFEHYIGKESIERRFRSHHRSWVAEDDQQIVGVLELRHSRQITLFFVDPRCRSLGIGTRLLQPAEQRAIRSADGQQTLQVHACLPVVPVYVRLGFRPTGQRKNRNGLVFATLQRKSS